MPIGTAEDIPHATGSQRLLGDICTSPKFCRSELLQCIQTESRTSQSDGVTSLMLIDLTDGVQSWIQLLAQRSILLPPQDECDWARQQLLQQLLRKVLSMTVSMQICHVSNTDCQWCNPLPVLDAVYLPNACGAVRICCKTVQGICRCGDDLTPLQCSHSLVCITSKSSNRVG